MGRSEIAASIRTRAELARSLATALSEPNAVKALHDAAGAIINGVLLCDEHAVEELERRKLVPKSDEGDKSGQP